MMKLVSYRVKKSWIGALLLSVLILSFSSITLAGVIPTAHAHLVDRCIKIANLDQFPEIVLIGYYTGPMITGYEIYLVNNQECLTKAYRSNQLKIYWNTKDKPNVINPDNLLLDHIEPYGRHVSQESPLRREEIDYSLVKDASGKLNLYKSKQITEYNNKTPARVETFPNPLNG